MEDEQQGDVGLGNSGSGDGVDLPLVDNMDSSENHVDESFEDEGDGGEEIMVEIVGSDVFVDGIGGGGDNGEDGGFNGEGEDSEAEVEDLDGGGHVLELEENRQMDASLDVSEAEVVSVVDAEVCNPGIGDKVVSTTSVGTECVTTTVITSEEKVVEDESVVKDGDLVTPEPVRSSVEAVVVVEEEEKVVVLEEKEEILPSTNDNAALSDDHVVADSIMVSDEAATDWENAESKIAAADDEKEILDAERKGPVQNDNQGSSLNEIHSVETVIEEKFDIVEKEEILPPSDDAASHGYLGANAVTSEEATNAEDAAGNAESKSADCKDPKPVDAKEVHAEPESNKLIPETDALVSDALDNEAKHEIDSVSHAVGMEVDYVMDLKEGETDIDMPDSGVVSNDERVKVDESIDTDMLHQNHVSSNELTELADGGDTAEFKEDSILDFEIEVDIESSSFPEEENIVQDKDQTPITASVTAVLDQKVSNTSGEFLDCSSEKAEKIDAEISLQYHDASAENIHLPEQRECSMVETADVTVTEDHVGGSIVEDQGDEQEVFVQITETSNDGAEKLESVGLMPNEVSNMAANSDIDHVTISSEITEKAELYVSDVDATMDDVNQYMEAEDHSFESNGLYIVEDPTSEENPLKIEETESDQKYQEHDSEEPELGNEEHASEAEELEQSNEEPVKHSSCLKMNQSGYLSSPENEGHFSVSDLVWGKVRSHPWWPGQIFDPSDASDKAVKHYKKDSYLVAYFGDRTFAWNDASVLKPFRSHFYQIEKQSNSELFQNAVTSALEEVSRRVELGLTCPCIPKDAYSEIEAQIVENSGIREESSRRYGVDKSTSAASFEPDKLLEYVRNLAHRPTSGADRLDLVIVRAQLSAFCRFKGFRLPAEFPTSGELLENDLDTERISDEVVNTHKRKHTPRDGPTSRKKERSLVDLMGGDESSPDAEDESTEKDSLADVYDKGVNVYAAKLSSPTNQIAKPSFRIGERISKVASQLTGATSLVKSQNAEAGIDGSSKISDSTSLNDMLLQLQTVAQNPKKGNLLNSTKTFLLGFRSSVSLNKRGRKRKTDTAVGGSGEEFEFDDVNDSYWTDRIVQNYAEEQLLHKNENGASNLQVVALDAVKSARRKRPYNSRKRYSTGTFPSETTEFEESVKRRKQESSPAELILNFAERKSVPSEMNLNKIFRRFGPVMESETEVDHESGRAKIIFKRGSDAEVAHNSAEKFNIFGPVLVNYQIGYSPLISVKISPLAIPQFQEDASLMI